jgi:hypothetical protein
MKELIDYFNEKYTKKKEYVCKDLKPARTLNREEYDEFQKKSGVYFDEISLYPLFKITKTENFPKWINYILKVGTEEIKGYMWNDSPNYYMDNDNGIYMTVNNKLNEVVLSSYEHFSVENLNCSLTLYINSFELPKLEYPKNKMDMYRAMSFIETVSFSLRDDNLDKLLRKAIFQLPKPNNINELNLMLDIPTFDDLLDIRKNAYFINPNKDNYYTVLDAIKKGKIIYRNLDTPLVNWSINKEEKWIKFNRNIAIVNETSWVDLEK